MIMPADNSIGLVHYFAGKYPDKIGWLISPLQLKKPPFYMPYAVDNGAFVRWNEDDFVKLLGTIAFIHKPLWVLCPDVVGKRDETLRLWDKWSPYILESGYKVAFACQDGMTERDVPPATCTFIGGSTEFKLENAHRFKGINPLFHIGRVSTENRIRWAHSIGADSIDGTGFFRGGINRYACFIRYFEPDQEELCLA
jgi:hypothetical protein